MSFKFKSLVLWCFIFSCPALATEEVKDDERFFSHLSTPARTLKPGHVAFESFPGANGQTTFFVNSLSVGVTDWLQVGAVPLFYVAYPQHKFNANFKITFYDSKVLQLGTGYSHFQIKMNDIDQITEEDGSITRRPLAEIGFLFLAANYIWLGTPWALGINATLMRPSSNSKIIKSILSEKARNKEEWNLDVSFTETKSRIWTLGLSETRMDIFELNAPIATGFGLSLTHNKDWFWFTRIKGGYHYFPSKEKGSVLVSFDF